MRVRALTRLLVVLAGLWGALVPAATPVRADDLPDTLTFRSLPSARRAESGSSYWARNRTRLLVGGAAVTLGSLVTSQFLLRAADRRYDAYSQSVDPSEIEGRYQDAQRFDRWSNAFVVLGELAAAGTLYLAWRGPDGPPTVSFSPMVLPGGAGLKIKWTGR